MLGIDLCQVLSESGAHQTFGLDIRPPIGKFSGLLNGFVKADITQDTDLIKKTGEVEPELVIHTAAYTDVDGCQLNEEKANVINSLGTRNVALACKEIDAVLFYISTDYVFDGKKQMPYIEDDEPRPINVYGRSKLEGENHIKSILKRYIIIRSSWLFGQYGKNFVDTILTKAKENKELKVVSDQIGNPTYTKDLAVAIKVLVDRLIHIEDYDFIGPGQIYHITNSGSCSWYEFASESIKWAALADDIVIKPILTEELQPPRPAPRPRMSILDNSRYNKLTGQPLRSWQEALRSYIEDTRSK